MCGHVHHRVIRDDAVLPWHGAGRYLIAERRQAPLACGLGAAPSSQHGPGDATCWSVGADKVSCQEEECCRRTHGIMCQEDW